MDGKKRDQTLDAVKGVAILLVMAGHILNLNHMEDPYIYDVIRAVQMPLFMVVSGCLCGMGRRVESLADYKRVMKKRAVSYLVPFFVWIVVLYPLELPGAILDTLFHLDYGLWFLMTLFLLTAMAYTAQLAASRIKGNSAVRELVFWGVWGALAVFVVLETLWGWEFLSPSLTRMYLPFYVSGYAAAVYGSKLVGGISEKHREQDIQSARESGPPSLWSSLLAAVCALVFFYLVIRYDLVDLGSPQAFLRQTLASFAGCYLIFWLCRRWPAGKSKGFFAWLGGYTLEIYALHFHFATLLNRGEAYDLYTWQGFLFALASFAVMCGITAALIFMTKKLWILDLLLYGKSSRGKKGHKSVL